MLRLKAGVLALILALSLSAVSWAQGLPPQVKYELDMIELKSAEAQAVFLESFEFRGSVDAAEYAFQMLAGGNLSGILGGLPFRLSAESREEHNMRLAAPAVIVSLGKTASLRVVEETFVPELAASGTVFRTSGVEIKVTPLSVDPAAREITSAFVIQTYGGENALRTTAVLQNGESLPLAIVRFTETGQDKAEERYFAVFVRAEIIHEPPDSAAFAVGGLGGLAGLLWPEEVVLDRDNYLWFALPVGPVALPEAGFQLGQRFYVRGNLQHTSYSPASVAGGFSLLPEGLDLEMQILWRDGKAYAALGLGDSIEALPGITLSGGWLPAVFELGEFQRQKSLYWFDAYFDGTPFNFRFRLLSGLEEDAPTVQSEVGYEIKEDLSVFLKLSMHKDRGNRVSAGLRWSF